MKLYEGSNDDCGMFRSPVRKDKGEVGGRERERERECVCVVGVVTCPFRRVHHSGS